MLYYLHEKISTSGEEHPGPLPRPMAVLYSCFVVCFHGRIVRIGGERGRGFDNVPSFIPSSSCIILEIFSNYNFINVEFELKISRIFKNYS